ncbi:methyl-accepting chemotaxis protein [Vibrio nitrifigilis]|uniref:Methyl-accepting chemotaxis protein n=1 Tax=Vibrio nitrifigilis TaxID=2789781 RepID=A0ABS0GKE0_9VIBR|nr:methyl-accepting chemotaxis protein [Vibrio nitrifigilis]MBF9002780.1 methyl-accepting chemotaxis protein [Vibrio nitrifigilis]
MRINRLTLQSRLIIAVAIPCIAALCVAITSLYSMSLMQHRASELYLNTANPMRAVAEAASRIPRMRVGIDMMLLQETSLKDAKGILTRVQETRNEDIPQMSDAMNRVVEAQVDPLLKKKAEKIRQQFNTMVSDDLTPLLAAFERGDIDHAKAIYRDQYAKHYSAIRHASDILLNDLLKQAEHQNRLSYEEYQSGKVIEIALIIIGLVISIVTAWVIITHLRQRVDIIKSTLIDAAQNLALNHRIDLDGRDELADIARSFNQFIEKLHSTIDQVAAQSRELGVMAKDVAKRSHQTQSNCTSQRDRTLQVATAINELGATVSEIANNAAQAADVAKEATERSGEGQNVVGQAREQIGYLSHELTEANSVVDSLAKQVAVISTTLETIRSISEQTNLLALNAAIEAARAGEQGRGFAVVADEVRTLASRSAQSTSEIQLVIDSLQNESKLAVNAMDNGQQQSQKVVDFANSATEALATINTHIHDISDQNIQVATATEEQSTVVEDINRNVEDINQLTNQTAEFASQLNQASGNLDLVSGELDRLVAQFKL